MDNSVLPSRSLNSELEPKCTANGVSHYLAKYSVDEHGD